MNIVMMPPDLCLASGLTPQELEGVRHLCRSSTQWSPGDLLTYVGTLKRHGDRKAALEYIAVQLVADQQSTKTRQQVFSYYSNWNRRYPPIIEWLSNYGPESPGPLKQLPSTTKLSAMSARSRRSTKGAPDRKRTKKTKTSKQNWSRNQNALISPSSSNAGRWQPGMASKRFQTQSIASAHPVVTARPAN